MRTSAWFKNEKVIWFWSGPGRRLELGLRLGKGSDERDAQSSDEGGAQSLEEVGAAGQGAGACTLRLLSPQEW
eukprot:4474051-Pleurochrysis_carterae.AAC.2